MKTPDRFNRALKALVQAFFNDTLAKGHCKMCAVGNMCGGSDAWSDVFLTPGPHQEIYPENYEGESKRVIDETGYSWKELARVEFAFERATRIEFGVCGGNYKGREKAKIMQDQFNGLMAVVDVLCEIEGLDSQEYKKAFEYNQDLTPVYQS